MKKTKRIVSLVLALCLTASVCCFSVNAQEEQANTAITNLETNSRVNPIGIDDTTPVFGWQMDSNVIGASQNAYRIVVSDQDGIVVWDSGKVESGISSDIHYQGEQLQGQTEYTWNLTVWDQNNHTYSNTANFETGLMDSSVEAWHGAEWIGTNEFFLDAESLKNFEISYDMQLEEGSTKAGIIYGADDPRMQNYTKNKWLLEGETYIYVELDVSGVLDDNPDTAATLNVYRKGFSPDDYEKQNNTTIFTAQLKDGVVQSTEDGDYVLDNESGITKENAYEPHHISLKTQGSGGLVVTLDGKTLSFVNHVYNHATFRNGNQAYWSYEKLNYIILNPNASVSDVNCFPQLNKIGFYSPDGNTAVYTNYVIHDNSLDRDVFGQTIGSTYSIWKDKQGVSIQNNMITVSGDQDSQPFYTDPSYGSIPYLRNEFSVVDKEIESARLYATAWGNYELYINGERFGEDWLSPGYTQYNMTLDYMTYDITDTLQTGENAIGFILSNGWLYDHGWEQTPALMAMMEIAYTDGTVDYITTDDSWKISTDTPIRSATFWQGEKYDATMEDLFDGWNQIGYNTADWDNVEIITPINTPTLAGKSDEPVRVVEERSATLLEEQKGADAQTYIYDMGTNMVGTVTINLPQMEPGTKLMFRYAEVLYPELDPDSEFYYGDLTGRIAVENLRGAYCTDYYICNGNPEGESITFSLTYHGFRYLEITGLDNPLDESCITGLVLSSIDDQINSYESSNELANQYFDNIMRSLWGNFVSIPTDCNQRDERKGWTGDAQVFSLTATYFGDVNSFYERWLTSARDAQALSGGSIGNTFPNASTGTAIDYNQEKITADGLCWSSAAIITPWNTYLQYGNKSILEDNYDMMKSFLDGVCREGNLLEGCNYLTNGGGLAEHLAFETTNPNIIQNAMFYRLLVIMEKVSTIVGDNTSAQKYATRAENVKQEWNEVYVDPETGKTHAAPTFNNQLQDTQASYTIPIAYGVVSDENLEKMIPNMVDAMKRGNVGRITADGGMTEPSGVFGTQGSFYKQGIPYTITTGFTGTPTILPALTTTGQIDIAYNMFEQTEFSSWLHTVTLGATSIWERWNAQTEDNGFGGVDYMNSFNHYASGAVGEWMIGTQAGITNDEQNPGYKHFILQPTPGGDYQFLDASYESTYGSIVSNWTADQGKLTSYEAVVPANTSATLYLPVNEEAITGFTAVDGITYVGMEEHNGQMTAKFDLEAGGYNFEVKDGKLVASIADGYAGDETETADKDILNAVIAYAESAKESGEYDNAIASVQVSFDTALENAKAVAQNAGVTQDEVDTAWKTLLNEIHKLGFMAGDKTELTSLIEAANGINAELDRYVETGKAEFTAALEAAQAVYEDGDAMQTEVNEAADNLLNAMLNLRYKADKSILEEVLAEASKVDANAYTAESYAALQAAVAEASNVYNNENASQEEVNRAVANVQAAMDDLVAVEGGTTETSYTDNATQTGQESTTTKANAAKTGDFTPIAGIAMLVVAGITVLISRKK